MRRILGVTDNGAAIQSLPSGPAEVNSNEIPFILVACKEYRMRYRFRGGTNGASVLLHSYTARLKAQGISRRRLQNMGNIHAFTGKLVRISGHSVLLCFS